MKIKNNKNWIKILKNNYSTEKELKGKIELGIDKVKIIEAKEIILINIIMIKIYN